MLKSNGELREGRAYQAAEAIWVGDSAGEYLPAGALIKCIGLHPLPVFEFVEDDVRAVFDRIIGEPDPLMRVDLDEENSDLHLAIEEIPRIGEVSRKRRKRDFGTRHGNSKLDDEKVLGIRREYESGKTMRELAGRYGVSRTTIHKVLTRETWNHI
jgi:hypothetical protein